MTVHLDRAATFQRPLQRQSDQAVHQLVQRHAAPLPETRVHADGGEAGDGIHLIDVDMVAVAVHEEIAARHAGQIERARRGDRYFLYLGQRAPVDWRRDKKLRVFVDVLGVVVVELIAGNDLADDRGDRLVVAEHRNLQLAGVYRFFDQDAAVESASLAHGGRELARVMRLDHAHTRAHVRWLDETGPAEDLTRPFRARVGVALPLLAGDESPWRLGQTFLGEDRLRHGLVHAERRTQHPGSDVGHTGQLQEPLHRSVFTHGAVQHRKDDVDTCRE